MDDHFDAIVVGSGFGGSVSCFRLAEAGRSVCLLERGHAYPPGSFPYSPNGLDKNFWNPSEGYYGMFDVWSFGDMEGVVSSGLGGGSLIYANVMIRKDENWFVKDGVHDGVFEYWPVTREDLDPHYERVERILKPTPYPLGHAPYDKTRKTLALKTAAEKARLEWYLPKLAITFGNDPSAPAPGERITERFDGIASDFQNLHGLPRYTCRLCGGCDLGCNYGSKNTLDYNYLSLAKLKGAEIRTCCEVRRLAPIDGGGFTVDYVKHDLEREGKPTDTENLPLYTITADRLILSAGTFGSTYLLLRNRDNFPGISDVLGQRFSGNGDLLAFVMDCKEEDGKRPRLLNPNYGPVITSTVRVCDAVDGGTGRGFYLQDAGYPDFMNWLVESSRAASLLGRAMHFVEDNIIRWVTHDPRSEVSSTIARLIGDGNYSASSMPLLGMGRDRADGIMSLDSKGKYLELEWHETRSQAYYDRMFDTGRRIARALGGDFRENALNILHKFITAHPLGGCSMGRNIAEGVVDSKGEVFNWPGLTVADGSVMPGPVGPNPSLTIAALADRFMDQVLDPRKESPT